MEIEINPINIEQRIEFLKQFETAIELNKKPSLWPWIIIGAIAGAAITYFILKIKEENKKEAVIEPS